MTTGTKILALFIWNLAPVMLLRCSVKIQSFVYDCGDRGGRGGLSGVFPAIFVLYLNDLSSEVLSSTSLILSL